MIEEKANEVFNFFLLLSELFLDFILLQVVASGAYLQAQADQRNAKVKSFKPDQSNEKKDRKEERRKKANVGGVGGGVQVCIQKYVDRLFINCITQGRETKTRSTKKKYLKGKNDSDDDEEDNVVGTGSTSSELEFMSIDEISNVLKKQEKLADAPDEFTEDIAARLYKSVQTL